MSAAGGDKDSFGLLGKTWQGRSLLPQLSSTPKNEFASSDSLFTIDVKDFLGFALTSPKVQIHPWATARPVFIGTLSK